MTPALWPSVNAALNATSAVLLVAGFLCIRAKRVAAHQRLMVTALCVSALFLLSYLAYHAQTGAHHVHRTGWIRPVYAAILITHTLLAMVIVPLALRTIFLARQRRLPQHRAMARWTLPLWLYVCVSGVAVYWMLYQLP